MQFIISLLCHQLSVLQYLGCCAMQENGDVDHSYFAPDCFHLSQKSHQGSAYMLWNVMVRM